MLFVTEETEKCGWKQKENAIPLGGKMKQSLVEKRMAMKVST